MVVPLTRQTKRGRGRGGQLCRRQGLRAAEVRPLQPLEPELDAELPHGRVLDVIGDGDQLPALRRQAARLGLAEAVRFHGIVADHREVERLLAEGSVAAAPYLAAESTFTRWADPGKLKAYLAAGLPIVLTDVPPNAQELSREAGAEIVGRTPDALAAGIERVLASPDAWRERRDRALAYVRRFDWPHLFSGLFVELGFRD